MKRYQNPEVYEQLSAQYVLGTLKGKALTRFEKLLRERPYIQYSVDLWQDRLAQSVHHLPPTKPPRQVWESIQAEISDLSGISSAGDTAIEKPRGLFSRIFGSAGLWQVTTAMMSLLLAAVLLVPQKDTGHMPMPSYVAVLESDHRTPMMVTMGDQAKRMVSVRIMEMPELEEEQELQLWAVHTPKSPPVPVGLLRRDNMETQLKLTPPEWQKIEGAQTFAISFEPKGGSPSGQPTGKIMYKGQCLDFI